MEIAQGFSHGVAAEFVESAAGQGKRNHGLAGDPGGRYYTNVGALIGGTYRLARGEIDRFQRASERGDWLQGPPDADLLSNRNTAFSATPGVAKAPAPAELCRL